MKRILLFWTTIALAIGVLSCQKAPELTLTGPSSVELSADGSSASITFNANRDWKASCSDSWVTVSPSSGTAADGAVTVTVRCNANTTYVDRTATVTIKMEELSQSVAVRQPANLGIVLPTQSFDLQSNSKTIEVTVQANVQYSVSSSVDWIKQTGTKALTSRTLTFSIAENKSYDAREGKITLKPQQGNVQEQVITVRQAQKDALNVEKISYDMPYGGGEIEIKVEANVTFDVTPNVDWLHYTQTKALGNSTVCIKVDENKTFSNREGKIEIAQKNGSLKHTITVKQVGRIAVTSVELNKTSLQMKEGDTETLVATVKPENATDKTITWSSSNANIASVDGNGKVMAVKEGTATITVKAGGESAACAVTIKKDVPVSSIALNKTSLFLRVGESETLTATIEPEGATDKAVIWSSSENSIAIVDENGKVTAIKEGSAVITAKAGEKSASCSVTVRSNNGSVPDGAVDLGLSVLWATKGLGASKTEEQGTLYAWGESRTKSYFGWDSYAFYDWNFATLYDRGLRCSKYNDSDKKRKLDRNDDAASVNLGGKWRMPTEAELSELFSGCHWERVHLDVGLGLAALKGTSNKTGETIIIPVWQIKDAAFTVKLWSSELSPEQNSKLANTFEFYVNKDGSEGSQTDVYEERYKGFYIRPVYDPSMDDFVAVSNIALDKTELTLKVGATATLGATIMPDNATDKTILWETFDERTATVDKNGKVTAWEHGTVTIRAYICGKNARCEVTVLDKDEPEPPADDIPVESISLNKSEVKLIEGESEMLIASVKPDNATNKTVKWSSSAPDIATVDSEGKVKAIKKGSATITASAVGGVKSATCLVTVEKKMEIPTAIDLGLSIKWGSFNLGASKPEEYGEYFAWGETKAKDSYTWETYTLSNGTKSTLTKYNSKKSSGTVDNKVILEANDDAAHVLLGGTWRMPSVEELQELITQCSWEWTSKNGTAGYLVKSKVNGNSIFLPAAGNYDGASLYSAESRCFYWTSSLFDDAPVAAMCGRFYVSGGNNKIETSYLLRCYGFAVRPVTE